MLDTGLLQLGSTLFVFMAINALALLTRLAVFGFRACTSCRSTDAKEEARAGNALEDVMSTKNLKPPITEENPNKFSTTKSTKH